MSSPRSTKRKAATYATYIPRIMKQVHPDKSITGIALSQLRAVAEDFAQRLSEQARKFATDGNRKTVTDRDVRSATHLVIPGELARHAVAEGMKAVTKYVTSMKATKAEDKKQTKAERSGLLTPPSLAEKDLRDHSDLRVGASASVYLAAVLEYLVAEILELAGNSARDNDHKRITVRDLYWSIQNDDELKNMVKTELLGGGVVPHINRKLLPSKDKKSKKSKKKSGEKSGRRNKPGTVALRKIRKYQKTVDLLLPKEQFRRLVRTINNGKKGKDKFRFSLQALDDLQYYTEQQLVKLMQAANRIGLTYDKLTLMPKSLRLAASIGRDESISSPSYEFEFGSRNLPIISNPGLLRLAQRAGVKRIDSNSYVEIKNLMEGIIRHILYPSVVILKNERKRTLTPQILRQGAKTRDINLAI